MKKVRFRTPSNGIYKIMDESECQSPRPCIERQSADQPNIYRHQRLVYSSDPVIRFESSDSSPYPLAKKTLLPTVGVAGPSWVPSHDLNLSMLDCHEPRPPSKSYIQPFASRPIEMRERCLQTNVLASIENNHKTPPNFLRKDDSFFIRRDNLDKYSLTANPLDKQADELSLDKENEPSSKKGEIMKSALHRMPTVQDYVNINYVQPPHIDNHNNIKKDCNCHHCNKRQIVTCHSTQSMRLQSTNAIPPISNDCQLHCQDKPNTYFHCDHQVQNMQKKCNCTSGPPMSPKNSVDKKTWAIEKYEQSNKEEYMGVERQSNLVKEKREPTISDLLKIIKLQNEQLQLLQDKVDKFISASNNPPPMQTIPIENYTTECVALQTIDSEHKISIGVMTSFEMVRTSTIINKEILTQTTENAQLQCNRSQVSIKEVVSKQPVNLNFLDGIMPMTKRASDQPEADNLNESFHESISRNMNEEKTLNELSLYNVHVDSATTPLMSPEQSLYLDVRDYSDSDSSEDQSNVGWTYYNKVMTHVNGMLQDSDMPSSASALCRNTRQQCVQMKIDKTNVSVTKRVKFGDDPLGIHQPHLYVASTDTSIKMNQLAAKYLNTAPTPQRIMKPTTTPIEMSFATRNYMERHKLLKGTSASRSPPPGELPKFLDITALKQQTKLL